MKCRLRNWVICLLALLMTAGLSMGPVQAQGDTTTVELEVEYRQTEARSILELVNEFRASGTWCYNWDEEKIDIPERAALTYDYRLEEVAMQRAAELALYYNLSHMRPNDSKWWTAWPSYGYSYKGENIAVSTSGSGQNIFNVWKEEDENYNGQGHRRNMLGLGSDLSLEPYNYNSIGIGCVYSNGGYYWAMELGKGTPDTNETDPADSARTAQVEVLTSYLKKPVTESDHYDIAYQSTMAAPVISASMSEYETWVKGKSHYGTVSGLTFTPEWTVTDPSIANISEGIISGLKAGETTLTTTVNGTQVEVGLRVTALELTDADVTLNQSSYDYTGSEITPELTVMHDGYVLTKDTDYTLFYEDNVSTGEATVTVTGTGNYTGTVSKTFKIVCNHTYDAGEITKEASCTEDGEKIYTCTTCGDKKTEIIQAPGHKEVTDQAVVPTCTTAGLTEGSHCSICNEVIKKQEPIAALGHTEIVDEAVAATCTEDGLTEGSHCSVCNEVIKKQEPIAALGHTEVVDEAVAATCTTTGLTEGSHCSVCHTVLKAQEETEALGHNYEEKVIEATCTERGYTEHTCSRCGDSYQDTYVDALGHDYVDNTVEATCTERGYTEYTCSRCDDSYQDTYVDALGHDYEENKVDPTCTEQGYTEYRCSRCGDDYVDQDSYTAALGHDYQEAKKVAPTCEEQGYTEYVCSRCSEQYTDDYVNALGHQYETVVTPPTCTEQGYTTYTCSVCNDTYTGDVTEALGHKWGEWNLESEATCVDDGKEVRECSACGEMEQNRIPAKGHSYVADITPETCTQGGSVTYTCTVCNDTYTEDLEPALGHDYQAVVTEPTCEEQGYTTYTCSRCKDSYVDDYTDALGHAYEAVVKEATCLEQGYTMYVCKNCKDSYIDEDSYVAALGHHYEEKVLAPTCTEQGYTVYTCSNCGDSYIDQDSYVAALGHDYEQEVVAPTCTEQGYTKHVCSRCEDVYATDFTEAKGHSFDQGTIVKEATCAENGELLYTCTVCGFEKTEIIKALSEHTPGQAVKENIVEATYTKEGSYDEVVYCKVCGSEISRNTVIVAMLKQTDTKLVVAEGLKRIPDALIAKGFDTKEKILDEMRRTLLANGGNISENEAIYDVELQVSHDGGKTWGTGTQEHFPSEGLTVVLPYPQGTNKDQYHFTVVRMFTTEMDGKQPGDVEIPSVTKTELGLQISISSPSPFYVSWEEIENEDTEDDTESSDSSGNSSESSNSSGSSALTSNGSVALINSAATGDSTNIVCWLLLLIVSVVGVTFIYSKTIKKKK